MPYSDLRSWIGYLEKRGHLAKISQSVDWKFELGAIMRKGWDEYGDACPAMLFENIKDYQPPRPNKVFVGTLQSFSRIAMMMDLPPKTGPKDLVKEYRKRSRNLIKPKIVKTGPCKDNILLGKDVDELKFPVPWWNLRDGNRYIGTLHAVVTKDPDTGWVNVGNYRMMSIDAKKTGISAIPGWQHIGYIYSKFIEREEPMEVAVAIGLDPVISFVAAAPLATGVCEYDVAGGINKKPVELVKCETVDLHVPATAELILEGTVDPRERHLEGPFGEFTGYYGSTAVPKAVFRIKCITHREDPIFQGTCEGYPVNEDHAISGIVRTAYAWDVLEAAAIPGVKDIACPLSSGGYGDANISIKPTVEGHEDWIASVLWGSSGGFWAYKRVIVVDEDIDPWNADQVNFAIFTRVKASEDVKIWKDMRGHPLDPRVEPEHKGFMDRWLIKATRPYEWKPRSEWGTEGKDKGIPLKFPPLVRPSPDMMRRVNKRWASFGIKPAKDYSGSSEGMFKHFWDPEMIEKVERLEITP